MKYLLIINLILLNCQALAQVPDNFNLVLDMDYFKLSSLAPTFYYGCDSLNQEPCWSWANKSSYFNSVTGGLPSFIDSTNPLASQMSYGTAENISLNLYNLNYDIKNHTYFDTLNIWRSYAEAKFLQPLDFGKRYYMSVILGLWVDSVKFPNGGKTLFGSALSNVGAWFTSSRVCEPLNNGRILGNPQVKIKGLLPKATNINAYYKWEYSFISDGTERFVTFGNFDNVSDFDTLHYLRGIYPNKINDTLYDISANITINLVTLVADISIPPINILPFKIGEDTIVCDTFSIVLKAPSYYGAYTWNNGATAQEITITYPGIYYCTANLACGQLSDTVIIKQCDSIALSKASILVIPNAFTPNGDNLNDVFSISDSKITPISLSIINRFGNQIYKSTSYFNWDGYYNGLPCDYGVYYYSLTYKEKSTNEIIIKNGDITLLK
jgi:gliding motility-associated-like protein